MRIPEFGPSFSDMLLEVQRDMPNMINSDIDLLEDFGSSIYKRRGTTRRAKICKNAKIYH